MSRKPPATIYTDGACSHNGVADQAKAGIGVYWPGNESNNISRPLEGGRQTNQRAEIIAVSTGLNQAREQGYKQVTVKTDSTYVKNAAESWISNWERNGYQSGSKPVTNKSEFQDLKRSMDGMDVKFEWVPSAANAADKLAREGASKVGSLIKKFIR